MTYRFKPNRAQKDAFIKEAKALDDWLRGDGLNFCAERAMTGTIYFTVRGQKYRVASHKPGINYAGEITFHASPLRAPQIARALQNGEKLNSRGQLVKQG